jgi:hypothetical protein
MSRRIGLFFVLALSLGAALAATDRAWQTGVWRDVQVARPKIVIGLNPGPAGGGQAQRAITETRTYVIETDTLRLELKELTTSDAPSLGAAPGERVTFALEKDTVYIKDDRGRERSIHVTKQSAVKK